MVKCSIGNRVGISLNLLFAKKSNKLTQIPKKQKAGQINNRCTLVRSTSRRRRLWRHFKYFSYLTQNILEFVKV